MICLCYEHVRCKDSLLEKACAICLWVGARDLMSKVALGDEVDLTSLGCGVKIFM